MGGHDGEERARVRVWYGARRSARAALIDDCFVSHWGRAVLVLPTRAAAAARRGALIARTGRGLWGSAVCDARDLATALLEGEGVAVRRAGDAVRRLAMQDVLDALMPGGAGPGVARHVLAVVNEIKQAAIEPETFRARLTDASAADLLVAGAYAAYQDRLIAAGLYDVPGLYWEAAARCGGARPRFLEGIDAVLFDGFDDFTPSEFRFVAALARHTAELAFGVPCDLAPERSDLYAAPRRTLDALRTHFDAVLIGCDRPAPARRSAFAADHLFSRDPPAPPAGLAPDLAIVSCADAQHEAETIARRAKALAAAGAAPEGIAVVFADLDAAAAPLEAAFAACGVPLALHRRTPLAETPHGAMAMRLLAAWSEWAHDAVLDAIGATAFGAGPHAPAFAALARAAAIVSGRGAWTHQLERLRTRLAAPHGDDGDLAQLVRRMPDAAAALDALIAAVQRLGAQSDALPAQGTRAGFAAAFDGVLAGLPCAAGAAPALEAVRAALAAMAAAPAGAAAMARAAFERDLALVLRETALPARRAAGAVQAHDPAAVRNLRFDRVFYGGLIEGAAPRPPAQSAVYGDRDRARLAALGVPLEGAREHLERERLQFHHAIETADAGVTLLYRRIKEARREASPSPFVLDVRALFHGAADLDETLGAAAAVAPPIGEAATERELRNALFLHGLPAPARFAGTARAAGIEQRRHGGEPFDAYDGVLEDPALRAALAQRFGPDRPIAVRRIENYLACPFDFFQREVIGIAESEAPEAEFDPRVRGSILHAALETFHRAHAGTPLRAIDADTVRTGLRAALEDAFGRTAWRSAAADDGVRAAEFAHLASLLERYAALMRASDEEAGWRPTQFEVAFGSARGAEPAAGPCVLETPSGRVALSGRIDRIDEGADGALRLVDYKSGQVPGAGDICKGRDVQLTVYAWAVEQLLMSGRPCRSAVYVPVGRRVGSKPWREALGLDAKRPGWAGREAAARAQIAHAAAGMREGRFPPLRGGKTCHGCGAARACRYDQGRIARKPGGAAAGEDAETEAGCDAGG